MSTITILCKPTDTLAQLVSTVLAFIPQITLTAMLCLFFGQMTPMGEVGYLISHIQLAVDHCSVCSPLVCEPDRKTNLILSLHRLTVKLYIRVHVYYIQTTTCTCISQTQLMKKTFHRLQSISMRATVQQQAWFSTVDMCSCPWSTGPLWGFTVSVKCYMCVSCKQAVAVNHILTVMS